MGNTNKLDVIDALKLVLDSVKEYTENFIQTTTELFDKEYSNSNNEKISEEKYTASEDNLNKCYLYLGETSNTYGNYTKNHLYKCSSIIKNVGQIAFFHNGNIRYGFIEDYDSNEGIIYEDRICSSPSELKYKVTERSSSSLKYYVYTESTNETIVFNGNFVSNETLYVDKISPKESNPITVTSSNHSNYFSKINNSDVSYYWEDLSI